MDILVGAASRVMMPDVSTRGEHPGVAEGSVLAIRMPRGARPVTDSSSKPHDERRRRRSTTRVDPPGSRVLTLLVTDPSGIPPDVDTAPYRVIVRFIREG